MNNQYFPLQTDTLFVHTLRVLIDRADKDPECPNLNDTQKEALDFLDSVCERKILQTRFTMKKGDILFLIIG